MIAGSKLEPCDLLFIVKGSGNAITAVTNGWHSRAIDHVAMVDSGGPEPTVCDATPRYGVCRRKLSEFLNAARADSAISEIIVGRVRVLFDADTVRARLQLLQGLPYDSLFLPDSRAIYCSELIQKVFVDKKGREVFTTIPMNFLDSQGRVSSTARAECPSSLPASMPSIVWQCHKANAEPIPDSSRAAIMSA